MSSSGHGGTPSIAQGSVKCLTMDPKDVPPAAISGISVSQWYWAATLNDLADGILTIPIKNPNNQAGVGTGVSWSWFVSGERT